MHFAILKPFEFIFCKYLFIKSHIGFASMSITEQTDKAFIFIYLYISSRLEPNFLIISAIKNTTLSGTIESQKKLFSVITYARIFQITRRNINPKRKFAKASD